MLSLRWVTCMSALLLANGVIAQTPAWEDFVEARAGGTEPLLSDFSHAGYRKSEVSIPDVGHTVFDVTDYGAVANDGLSDRIAIEAAIDAAESNGSGVVFFPPGRFHLNTLSDVGSTILIRNGNIVFRGSGMFPGGTELFMEKNFEPSNPDSLSSTPFVLRVLPLNTSEPSITTITDDSQRETRSVTVESAISIEPDDWVTLYLSDPNATPSFLTPYTADASWERLFNDGIQVRERHKVESVDGNTVTFFEPIHVEIDSSLDWQIREYAFIEEVGFEDIAFVGNWKGDFVHHRSALDDGGWSALRLDRVVNGWIRRCRFTDWNYGIYMDSCSDFTILHTILEGNPGHHSIHTRRGTGVLVGLSCDLASHWHGPGMGYQSASTVYWRYEYNNDSSWDSHSGTPHATLMDCVTGGLRYGRSGGPLVGMPNHLRDFTLWNFNNTNTPVSNYDFWRSNPNSRDRYLNPIIIGFHGNGTTFNEDHLGLLESYGTPVVPESLFEAQLSLRLGSEPEWIPEAKAQWDVIRGGLSGRFQSPVRNGVFEPGSDIPIELELSSSVEGALESVVFSNQNGEVGTTGNVPFSYIWNGVPFGTYELTGMLKAVGGLSFPVPSHVFFVGHLPQAQHVVSGVTATSAQEPNVADNVLDDDPDTRWSAEGDGEAITLDLGGIVPVNRIDLAWYQGDQRSSRYTVRLSNDGSVWRTALTAESGGVSLDPEPNYFVGGPARFVQLVGHGNSVNQWNSITEIQLFSPFQQLGEPSSGWILH